MRDDELLAAVSGYYGAKVEAHGATPQGVDWNGAESQGLRFDRLLDVIPKTGSDRFTLTDYGCGYGALLETLSSRWTDFRYQGYDVSESMVRHAQEQYGDDPRASFTADESALAVTDFTVASGIFNVRLDLDEPRWDRYVLQTLDQMAKLSRRGMAFNALTAHADAPLKRGDLHYADPAMLLDHCLRHYSRDVVLRHDYGLYEFTIVVRLDGRPPAIQHPGGQA